MDRSRSRAFENCAVALDLLQCGRKRGHGWVCRATVAMSGPLNQEGSADASGQGSGAACPPGPSALGGWAGGLPPKWAGNKVLSLAHGGSGRLFRVCSHQDDSGRMSPRHVA